MDTQWPNSLRQDGEPTAVGILRSSQQIYQEIIDMWYGLATFGVDIYSNHIYIFDHKISMPLHLPLVTRFLKYIQIRVHMQDRKFDNQNNYNPAISAFTDQLVVYSVHLQRLEIILMVEGYFYEIIRRAIVEEEDFGRMAKSQLEYNLEPIIKSRKTTVSWYKIGICMTVGRFYDPEVDSLVGEDEDEIEDTMQRFVDVSGEYLCAEFCGMEFPVSFDGDPDGIWH